MVGRKPLRQKKLPPEMQEIKSIIETGVGALGKASKFFWAGRRKNEIKKNNISFYVANAFASEKCFVYAEVPFMYKSSKTSLDYLIINSKSKWMLLIEAKRLHNNTGAISMANDYKRINKFKFLDGKDVDYFKDFHAYGLLLATTWDNKIAEWWRQNEKRPADCDGKGWEKVYDIDPIENSWWGRKLIQTDKKAKADRKKRQYAVYLLFSL